MNKALNRIALACLAMFVLLLLMLGIAVPLGTSIIVATVSGFAIFFAILLFGQGRVREAP